MAVADRLAQALGGAEAWRRLHFLRYDWVFEQDGKATSRFSHLWDKYTGRYRVEGMRDSKKVIVLFNLNTKEGAAFVDGKEATGAAKKDLLEFGYRRFINDGYWTFMPFKWKYSGVRLQHEGEEQVEGKAYDVVRLSFDNVGLTPKDVFWGYVNKQTGLMDQWAYILQGKQVPRTYVKWTNWKKLDGIQLATEKDFAKVSGQPDRRVLIENLASYSQADDRYFTTPAANLSELR